MLYKEYSVSYRMSMGCGTCLIEYDLVDVARVTGVCVEQNAVMLTHVFSFGSLANKHGIYRKFARLR